MNFPSLIKLVIQLFVNFAHGQFPYMLKSILWFSCSFSIEKFGKKYMGIGESVNFFHEKKYDYSIKPLGNYGQFYVSLWPLKSLCTIMGNFWLVSWFNVFKSWLLIGCQQVQNHLPIIMHTAWVTVFNLFKYLNDLWLNPKLFESIQMALSLCLIFFQGHFISQNFA